MVTKFLCALGLAATPLLVGGCDQGPKNVFTDAEIAAFSEEFEDISQKAKSTGGAGKPLMWTLSDEDTDIHLFGTIHVLPPNLEWRSDEFNAAFEAAHTVVFEVVEDESEEDALGMLMDGMSDIPLRERLSERDYERVRHAAERYGIPMASLDVMKPWMAAITLEFAMVYEAGFEDDQGVEVVLEAEAAKAGKDFAQLETSEFQLTLFNKLSDRAQLEYLVGGAASVDIAAEGLKLYLDEWLDGDFEGMNAIASTSAYENHEGYNEFYNLLLKDRNAAWIPQIEDMLNTPGTIMIAVGAGHLEGPDSVITMLRDKGYEVTGP